MNDDVLKKQIYLVSIYSIENIEKPELLIEVPLKAESKSEASFLGQDIAFDKNSDSKRMIEISGPQ